MGLNIKAIIKITSAIIALLGIAMIPSFVVSIIYREFEVAVEFIKIILPTMLIGFFISRKVKTKSNNLKIRDGFLIVALSWFIASLIGSAPYMLTDVIDSFTDAFFESTSGFTTTGATVIADIEILPKGILFWRSFCQWLGAMGILIFAISLLPALGMSGQLMARAETPGPTLNKLVPRMSDSAKILYIIYIVFTISAVLLLLFGGMNLFDAIIAAFSSVSSGGLSNYNMGIAEFGNLYIKYIAAIFTVLVCINFTLYYNVINGNWHDFFADRELRTFLGILAGAVLLITGNLWIAGVYGTIPEAFHYAFFQASSFITTTGHFSTDFNQWPSMSKMIMFLLMLTGACSASTGGGIKVIRIIVLFKLIRRGFYKRLHPRAVSPIKVHDKIITSENMTGITSFLFVYIFIYLFSILILSFENTDLITAVTAVAASLNNVGTGFELVGPTGTFAEFSGFTKVYLCFLMMVGRLELFTILLLFMPSYWNPNR